MKFTLEIELGNDAMSTPADIAGALRDLAGRLEGTDTLGIRYTGHGDTIRDANNNTVGSWDVSERPDVLKPGESEFMSRTGETYASYQAKHMYDPPREATS
jgi:hypothetical protein